MTTAMTMAHAAGNLPLDINNTPAQADCVYRHGEYLRVSDTNTRTPQPGETVYSGLFTWAEDRRGPSGSDSVIVCTTRSVAAIASASA